MKSDEKLNDDFDKFLIKFIQFRVKYDWVWPNFDWKCQLNDQKLSEWTEISQNLSKNTIKLMLLKWFQPF